MPPSPEHMAVLTAALPLARAVLASSEMAPKDIWLTYIGVSIIRGCFALGPMIVLVLTGSSSFKGSFATCAPLIRISSHFITGLPVRIGSRIELPVSAIVCISAIVVSSSSDLRR